MFSSLDQFGPESNKNLSKCSNARHWVFTLSPCLPNDQANLEQNEYKYELELEELHKVESRIATLEPEYDGVMKKRQLAEERRKELARLLKLKTRAALIAQAWWRGYCVRKALAGKSKGKKDKKQKGKKK